MLTIPKTGMTKEAVFDNLQSYRAGDLNWRDGRTWAYVYDPGGEVEAVIKEAYMDYLSENALDPTAFPSVLKLETEVVAMAAAHLKGDDDVVGNFTSGGTESIILAVKTARDRARALRPEITRPEIILPVTGHAAFQKAAHYLDVVPVLLDVDAENGFRVDPEKVRAAITENTILLVGSAISYAHGTVDPIEELGQLALEHDLLLHVDGCMGGFMLPYFRRLGCDVPRFEFDVPGVTSISMDLHKYAFAAKGASVLLHKNKGLRKYQIYTCANWSGYTIVNPTVQSSKTAGPLAAAWAVLNFVGDDGYLEMAKTALDATGVIADGIRGIDGLYLLAEPDMNLIAFASDEVNIFQLADEMSELGWYIQPQLAFKTSKENIHLSVNPASARWADDLIRDLAICTDKIRGASSSQLVDMVRAAFAHVDPNSLSDEMFRQMLAMGGIVGTELPDKMAEINDVLNALPTSLREKVLTEFLNDLFQYKTSSPVVVSTPVQAATPA